MPRALYLCAPCNETGKQDEPIELVFSIESPRPTCPTCGKKKGLQRIWAGQAPGVGRSSALQAVDRTIAETYDAQKDKQAQARPTSANPYVPRMIPMGGLGSELGRMGVPARVALPLTGSSDHKRGEIQAGTLPEHAGVPKSTEGGLSRRWRPTADEIKRATAKVEAER